MRRFTITLCAAVLAAAPVLASPAAFAHDTPESGNTDADTEALPDGLSSFVFADWAGTPLPVWAYIPPGTDRTTAPILFVMHGAPRDPERYLKEWVPHAQAGGFIAIAPHFAKPDFATSRQYNMGWIREKGSRRVRDEEDWSFSAIEPLFDHIRAATGSTRQRYSLYGHSAGSQFVHRYLFLKPDARVERYLPANAGWYSFPYPDTQYPYGLEGVGVDEEQLRGALAKDVVILLGDQDTDPRHSSLNRSSRVMWQGEHRLARGVNFYREGRKLAEAKGWDFGWKIRVIPGVAHSNGGMAAGAADLVE